MTNILTKLGVKKPYIVSLLILLGTTFGGLSVYTYHVLDKRTLTGKYEALREEKVELQLTMTKTVAEYEKKLKSITKQTETRKDGTVIVTETDVESEEAGKSVSTSEILYQGRSFKLIETEFKWSSGYTLNALWFPSLTNPTYTKAIGFSVTKDVLWGLGVGPVITYDIPEAKFWFGVSFAYSF